MKNSGTLDSVHTLYKKQHNIVCSTENGYDSDRSRS